jgi:hypothetical protein
MNISSITSNPFVKKIKNYNTPDATGQWADFLTLTTIEKQAKGYLVFDNSKYTAEIDGLRFDQVISEEIRAEKMFTEHVLESGRNVSDASYDKPLEITLHVRFGDIFVSGSKIRDMINLITATVGMINTFLPKKSQSQVNKLLAIKSKLEKLYSKVKGVIDGGLTLLNVYNAINPRKDFETRTQQIMSFLTFIRNQSILLNIYTLTSGNLRNIVLKSIVATNIQEATNMIEATLVFRQIDFAYSQIDISASNNYAGRAKGKASSVKTQQNTEGKPVQKQGSTAYYLLHGK